MVNIVNVQKWVAALRSDGYEQGRGNLCYDGKWCCLGVACDLAIKDGVPINVTERAHACDCEVHKDRFTLAFDGAEDILPAAVRDWLGLESRDPTGIYEGDVHTLSKLNDDGGFPFHDIATIIEKTYLLEDQVQKPEMVLAA